MYDINRLNNANEVWYILYFDPEYVTIYASAHGYDEGETSLVGKYKHELKDITANGDVYLKIGQVFYRLDEISLNAAGIEKMPQSGEIKWKLQSIRI